MTAGRESLPASPSVIEYRLSWDSPDSWRCASMEYTHGKGVWPRLTEAEWDELPGWHRTEVIFTGDERIDQYHTLKKWAADREQPIRNVTLERREIIAPDEGWGPA